MSLPLKSHDRLQVYGGHTDMIMCMTIHKSMVMFLLLLISSRKSYLSAVCDAEATGDF